MSDTKRISKEGIINKTSLINPQGSSSGGFTCNVCSASFTVYDAYLDHCNSRLHLNNAGLAPVERVDDVERIRERLAYLRQKKETQRISGGGGEDVTRRVEERIAQRRMQEEQRRQEQRKKAAAKKETTDDTREPPDEETVLMASVLGISSFK